MRPKQHRRTAIFAAGLLTSMPATAVDELYPEDIVQEPPQRTTVEAEAGLGYVDTDSSLFGRYTGLTETGPFFVGDILTRHRTRTGAYVDFLGRDLGLDSRSLRLETGRQGRFGFDLDYYQLPHVRGTGAQTPFLGVGSGDLSLPAQWVREASTADMPLDATLRDFDLESEREGVGAGFSWLPARHWTLRAGARREAHTGVDRIGGAINAGGGGGGGGALASVSSAILPEPIDYTTDFVDLFAGYSRGRAQAELRYELSSFDNGEDSLRWDNPFLALPDPPGLADSGNLALDPDNSYHRLSVSGGYLFPRATRLTGLLSVGRMEQDEPFEPVTINPSISFDPLPRDSLEGRVDLTTALVKLSSRPGPSWQFNAGYRYYDRDNRTAQAEFDWVLNDGRDESPVTNEPYSYQQQTLELDGSYRFNPKLRLLLDYAYDQLERDRSQVERTRENSVGTELDWRPITGLSTRLYYRTSVRIGSDYQPGTDENPLLRKYYLADRDRDQVGLRLRYMPGIKWVLGASAEYVTDEYPDTEIGLVEAERPTAHLDVSYTPSRRLTLSANYSVERLETSQAGSDDADNEADWFADIQDEWDTIGLGIRWAAIEGRLDLAADYVKGKTRGTVDLSSEAPVEPYPELQSDLDRLSLIADYRLQRRLGLRFRYVREELTSADWALDGVEPDTLDRALLLGEQAPNYKADFFTVSLTYQF